MLYSTDSNALDGYKVLQEAMNEKIQEWQDQIEDLEKGILYFEWMRDNILVPGVIYITTDDFYEITGEEYVPYDKDIDEPPKTVLL